MKSRPLLLNVSPLIDSLLAFLFNLSFNTGVFPECFKTARVIPLFKQGDRSLLGNYRPISLLNVFNKILEKLMYVRVHEYLHENHLLYNRQYGFRKGFSTSHAVMDVVKTLNINISKKNSLLEFSLTYKKLLILLIIKFY